MKQSCSGVGEVLRNTVIMIGPSTISVINFDTFKYLRELTTDHVYI